MVSDRFSLNAENSQPIFQKKIEVRDSPTQYEFSVDVSDINATHIVKIYTSGGKSWPVRLSNKGEIYINAKKYPYTHSFQSHSRDGYDDDFTENYLDSYTELKSVNLDAKNKFNVIVRESAGYFDMEIKIYQQNEITSACRGIPMNIGSVNGRGIKEYLKSLKTYRGTLLYRKVSDKHDNIVEFENYVLKNPELDDFFSEILSIGF